LAVDADRDEKTDGYQGKPIARASFKTSEDVARVYNWEADLCVDSEDKCTDVLDAIGAYDKAADTIKAAIVMLDEGEPVVRMEVSGDVGGEDKDIEYKLYAKLDEEEDDKEEVASAPAELERQVTFNVRLKDQPNFKDIDFAFKGPDDEEEAEVSGNIKIDNTDDSLDVHFSVLVADARVRTGEFDYAYVNFTANTSWMPTEAGFSKIGASVILRVDTEATELTGTPDKEEPGRGEGDFGLKGFVTMEQTPDEDPWRLERYVRLWEIEGGEEQLVCMVHEVFEFPIPKAVAMTHSKYVPSPADPRPTKFLFTTAPAT